MSREVTVDVDKNSGFCAGVIRAVNIAEEKLEHEKNRKIFSLGALVHNEAVLSGLETAGLVTIDREDLDEMQSVENADLIIRAHGEPPATYARAEALGFNVVDCTCPVVLQLQKRIRTAYMQQKKAGKGQIVIFGKVGHAEELGLEDEDRRRFVSPVAYRLHLEPINGGNGGASSSHWHGPSFKSAPHLGQRPRRQRREALTSEGASALPPDSRGEGGSVPPRIFLSIQHNNLNLKELENNGCSTVQEKQDARPSAQGADPLPRS